MQYLITFSYHNRTDDQLKYFSHVTPKGLEPTEIIAMLFRKQSELEFADTDEAKRNYKERLCVVCCVPLSGEKEIADIQEYVNAS